MSPIDFFDKLRFWGYKRNPVLQRLKFYGLINKGIEIAANIYLPLYFKLTKNNRKYRLEEDKKDNVIVSLTSFPKRLPTLHLVIESILRQKVKPDRIVLYLTASQVPDIEKLPKKLLDLRERGLEIRLAPDEIRSHTKYYYAFKDFPESLVITVDDDLFYRSDLVESHLRNHGLHPDAIVVNWAKEIIPGKYKYNEWPDNLSETKKYPYMLLLGVASVLYPPHAIHEDGFNINNIKTLSLTADDVWLSAMAIKKGTPFYFTAYEYNHLPVRIKGNETLLSVNTTRNQVCIDNIDAYYEKIGEKRPFRDIKE